MNNMDPPFIFPHISHFLLDPVIYYYLRLKMILAFTIGFFHIYPILSFKFLRLPPFSYLPHYKM